MASFRLVFVAVIVATALVVGALLLQSRRPRVEVVQARPEAVQATGKCASCHRQETEAIVQEFELSRHAAVGTTCLDCHGPAEGQEKYEHRGFVLTREVTAKNCTQCHAREYEEFLRSRHAAPAFAAVVGPGSFTPEQVAFSEQYNPGAVNRPANPLTGLEGNAAITSGCISCHSVGKPNKDGSIGACTACHTRHRSSVGLARLPETCGQCHMGPDHSQLEIYRESKHGIMFNAFRSEMNLEAKPNRLQVADMPVPTCSTCHMSGIGGGPSTHNPGTRLSYYLFAEISQKRPTYQQGRDAMMAVCGNCHTSTHTKTFFQQAENVVTAVNARVTEARALMDGLHARNLLSKAALDEPIEYTYFDFWHYYGRTAKHGAFMGGADFVQWHGNYELTKGMVELRAQAAELTAAHGGAGTAGAIPGNGGATPGAGAAARGSAGAAPPAGVVPGRGR